MKPNRHTILLTGATGSFGRHLTARLLNDGHRVLGTSRSSGSLNALVLELKRNGVNTEGFEGIPIELSDTRDIHKFIQQVLLMEVTALVNNARSLEYLKTEMDGIVKRDNFIQEYALDVVTPYELTMHLAMQDGTSLRQVINIGSQYGSVASNLGIYEDPMTESPIHYAVAKAALVHLTKELALRLAPRHIQVNCISYGGISGRADDAFLERYSRLSPIGRMLTPEEVVNPVSMILEYPNISMTGHVVHADGGWSLW